MRTIKQQHQAVNGQETTARTLTEFNYDGNKIPIEALTDAVLLLGHGLPFGEPNFPERVANPPDRFHGGWL